VKTTAGRTTRTEPPSASGVVPGSQAARVLRPTPVLELLAAAAELLDEPAARIVAALAVDYPHSLQRRPATLVQAAGTTPFELNRLLLAAGFADLDDLRRQYARQSGTRSGQQLRFTTHRTPDQPERASLEQLLEREQRALAQTLRHVQGSGTLEVAARAILLSRRRWVFGDLGSRGYAQLFATEVAESLGKVGLIEASGGPVLTALADAHRLDSLTIFCIGNPSRLTVRLAEQCRELDMAVILVTDRDTCPVGPVAQHVLRVGASGSAGASPAAVAVVGHALALLSGAGAKGAGRRARRAERLAAALDWYEPDSATRSGNVP
jgi:DNA-binding MurR/RpiR family transcriptional regulator